MDWGGEKQQSPLSDALINNKSSTLAAAARTMLKCYITYKMLHSLCYIVSFVTFWDLFFFSFSFLFELCIRLGIVFVVSTQKKENGST
jgi:hypothetical protein